MDDAGAKRRAWFLFHLVFLLIVGHYAAEGSPLGTSLDICARCYRFLGWDDRRSLGGAKVGEGGLGSDCLLGRDRVLVCPSGPNGSPSGLLGYQS